MLTCPRCATPNPAGFRFCGNCAARLEPTPGESAERRKVVSVLFCDVAGSTSIGEQRDPEAMRAVMSRYFEVVRAVLERHGATVEKFIGDAVMAVFGHPVLHEDDALRAVRAAADLREALVELNVRLEHEWGLQIELRTGVNTGQVVAGDTAAGQTLVTGDAVNVAARLQVAAAPGETLIGSETYRLVRHAVHVRRLEPLQVKGKELPVAAWRLISVERQALAQARHLDSPLVGRQREKRLLQEAFEQADTDRSCVLFTLLGPAGVGKSRLVHEFLGQIREEAIVLRGRCLPYGEGITFWPLAEVVRQAAGIDKSDTPEAARQKIEPVVAGDRQGALIGRRVAAAIGLLVEESSGEELFWAVRRFFELLAERQPLVVVFDDIHWAEPTFLDLLEHLADWSHDAPILLLCVARPELLEARPSWAGGKLRATTLMLQSLSDEQVRLLIANLLGDSRVAEAVRDRVAESAEGNPLFVEEFVAMLIDDGYLRLQDGRWLAESTLEMVAVPPTIRSLLAARIDRLAPPERSVIERASVVGKVFWRGAVAELAPEPARAEVGPSLLRLVRKELVRPDHSDFAGDEAFRFRHLLMRDAAYDALPKQERVLLHERFAGWLERTAGERVAEYEELLGYHLEQAYRYRVELGPLDNAGRELSARAGRRLASAGQRALELGDTSAAAKLLRRAAELLPAAEPVRLDVLAGLAHALTELGRYDEARGHADQLAEAARGAGPRPRWRALHSLLDIRFALDPEGMASQGLADTESAIGELEEAGDDLALAEAWNLRGGIHYYLGDLTEATREHLLSLDYARRAGSMRHEGVALIAAAAMGVWDDRPVPDAIRRAEEALEWARAAGRRLEEGQLLGILGRLLAMRGDIEEGRRLVGEGRQILAELGRRVHFAGSSHWLAVVELMAGDTAAFERALREGAEELERLGERSFLSSSLAEMALAMVERGRIEEAERHALRARELAGSEDVEAHVVSGAAVALVALERGRVAEAGRLAEAVRARIEASGYLITRIIVRYHLLPVLLRVRGRQAAVEELRSVRELALKKGMGALLPRLELRLAELEAQRADEVPPAGA